MRHRLPVAGLAFAAAAVWLMQPALAQAGTIAEPASPAQQTSSRPADLVTVSRTVDTRPPVVVRVLVRPEHVSVTPRLTEAAEIAVRTGAQWLGPFPHAELVLVDAAPGADLRFAGAVAAPIALGWFEPKFGSGPERTVIDAVVRLRWNEIVGDLGARDRTFVSALAQYTSAQLLEAAYQHHTESTSGAGFLVAPLFGGQVPYVIKSIRLDRDHDLMRHGADPDATRLALAIATLERYMGRPAFEGVMHEFATSASRSGASRSDFFRVAESVSGTELGWFVRELAAGHAFDYGVRRVSSTPVAGGRVASTVTIGREAPGVFSGSSRARVGPFEAGRAIEIEVGFADGSLVRERWDGRDPEVSFAYDSATPITTVAVDPDEVLLLDANRTNNTWTRSPARSRASLKWTLRWMIWLQDALLSWASLV